MKGRRRLDERVLDDGFAHSRSHARALILSGVVLVNDTPADKAGMSVLDTAVVRLRGEVSRFVSRGGDKLAGAIEDFALNVDGLSCLDAGASTGGFTDCLLQNGAKSVVAVDVGRGQIHEKLRNHARVVLLERVNARHLEAKDISLPVDLVVADVSFISLRLLFPAFARVAPQSDWLLLVKPQFEVGRSQVGKGGVVRDDALREEAVSLVVKEAENYGYCLHQRSDSRLAGPSGNREIFVWLVRA